MVLVDLATATAEQDPQDHRLKCLLWVDGNGAKILNEALKKLQDNPGDPDDTKHIADVKAVRETILIVHDMTNPS